MIPHNKPTLGREEIRATKRVINSGCLVQGEEVKCFEDEFCKYLGLPTGHAVSVSSGSAALFLALWALNAKNKMVSFPVYVCSALKNAVAMIGAKERFVDTESDSPNINIDILNRTKPDIAIIPHMYGIPVDINSVNKIPIIEDCCQSLGAVINGESTGLKGDIGIFSFYATKLITTGGHGGMVVSKNELLIETVRDYIEFDGRDDRNNRFNFQMTDLQAAIGREQLRKLPGFLKRREEIFMMYQDAGFNLLYNNNSVKYRAVIRTDSPIDIIKKLLKKNIKAIVPIEHWELLDEPTKFPNALELTKKTVSIPCYPSLTNSEVNKVIRTID